VLAGEAESAVSAGDEACKQFRINGKGGGTLAGVEDSQAAGGAGAYVEETAVESEAGGDFVDGAGDVGELGTYG